MKRFTKIAAVMLCGCILSGCTENIPFIQPRPDYSAGYTVSAEINCGKLEAKANISYNNENDWEFTFTEPKSLSGMKLTLTEEGVGGELGALSFGVDESDTYTLLPKVIAKTVEALADVPSESRRVSDGIITIDTEYDGNIVTVTSDTSGDLISLKCPYYSLSVNFSDQNRRTKPETSSDSEENSEEEEPAITITPVD